MRLTVLGRYGPYPAPGGATSGYIVETKGKTIVLDMGAGTLSRLLLKKDIGAVDAVFISHLHYDHTSDLLPLRYLLEDIGRSLKLIIEKTDDPWYEVLTDHPLFDVTNVKDGDSLMLGDVKLSFFAMEHTVKDLAVKIEGDRTLLYTGDTVMNEKLLFAARQSDAVLADCSKPADFDGPHMNVCQGLSLGKKSGARILMTHLSPGYDPIGFVGADLNVEVVKENKCYEI